VIHKVRIQNFKSLREVTVELERFTVFVGPNGSGKSSILQALDGVSRLFLQPQRPGGDNEVYQARSRGTDGQVELNVQAGSACFRYCSRSVASGGGGQRNPVFLEAADFESTQWQPWRPIENNQPGPIPKTMLLRLATQNLISTSFNPADNATMATDGTGLHAALASMALNEPETWQTFQNDLREIIPTIRRLRHAKMTSGQVPALQFDTVGADSLRADQMSEGSLLILGMLTALYAPNRPNLILLDDLDRGLHPKAQKDLITLLRRLLEQNQDLQLVATTHSPFLLNWMSPSEVRMTCLREDGTTVCAPIDTHPQFEKWKDEMAPGEMWSLFGEKWLIEEGVPV
jgi:predicted ATPase